MSDRERWIVYPLLFLTMGTALHDKFLRQVNTDRIQCKELVVLGPKDETAVVLSASPAGGTVTAVRADQKFQLVLGHKEHSSSLFAEAVTPDGPATWSILGNLPKQFAPTHAVQLLPDFPLIEPRFIHPPADDKR